MKNLPLIILILFIAIISSGCNKYILANKNDEIYYGAYNRRDMIHADVKLYKLNTKTECNGMIFLNAPSRSITFKNDFTDAKMFLSCTDGKLIDTNMKFKKGSFTKGFGEGFDQLNNKYIFKEISKNKFKEYSNGQKMTFINDKNSSLIKY